MEEKEETTTAETAKTNKEMQQELELQLHEQYAQNNNSYFSSIVVLISALLAVLGVYGYVFVRTTDTWATSWNDYYNSGEYSLDALMCTGFVATFVLTLCFHICVYQGSQQRKEQFIIDFIRRNYYKIQSIDESSFDKTPFPKGYHPCNKKWNHFVQGLYMVFVWYIIFTQIMILFSLLFRICKSPLSFSVLYNIDNSFHMLGNISILFIVVCFIFEIFYFVYRYKEYRDMNKEYHKKPVRKFLMLFLKIILNMKHLLLTFALILTGTSTFAQSESTLKGDVNEDGKVDVADINAVIKIMKDGGGTSGETIYYWYAGQTPPSSISGTPTVDDTNFTNNKWHTIGQTLINIGKIVTGGVADNEWYVAVPKDKYQPTASDLSTPNNSWTIIDTITVGTVQYSVYDTGNDLNRCATYLKVK